jgi:hypothetical protein
VTQYYVLGKIIKGSDVWRSGRKSCHNTQKNGHYYKGLTVHLKELDWTAGWIIPYKSPKKLNIHRTQTIGNGTSIVLMAFPLFVCIHLKMTHFIKNSCYLANLISRTHKRYNMSFWLICHLLYSNKLYLRRYLYRYRYEYRTYVSDIKDADMLKL